MQWLVRENKQQASEKNHHDDYGATIHKRIKLMSHSGMKANVEKEKEQEMGRERERKPAHQMLMHI